MTLCAPGGPKVIEKIGEIMGVAVEIPVKKKPVKKTVEKKVVAQTGDPISASAEFIEKNKDAYAALVRVRAPEEGLFNP